MSSKQTKKPAKKTSKKKTPAKKPVAKKASASQKTTIIRPEDADRLQNVREAKQVIVDQSPVIRANDVKSLPLRKRMLAWFKISK